jgi:hypothetical protein
MTMSNEQMQLLYTAITRFGTILFIIYIISVLLHVFRYVMRLAAYHDARAQALLLAVNLGVSKAKPFADYAAVLAAEKIPFGDEPSTPLESATELLKAAAETVKPAKLGES